jgi:hypothetical protein
VKRTIIVLVGLWTGMLGDAFGDTNSWLGGDGNWQTQIDWSLNQIPNSGQAIAITNTGNFAVTIDDQTASNSPTTMTISSLSASNTAGTSTLLLTNTPLSTIPVVFTVTNNTAISAGAVLNLVDASSIGAGVTMHTSNIVVNGTVLLQGNATLSASGPVAPYNVRIATAANTTGAVSIIGSSLISNSGIAVGEQGFGSLLMSNATLQAGEVDVGISAGAHGVWQMTGSSNTVTASSLQIGGGGGQTGEVVVAGGAFNVASFTVNAGGVFTVSNGAVNASAIGLGTLGSNATVVVSGGALTLSTSISLGATYQATVWQTGGTLSVMNPSMGVIDFGSGNGSQLICSGGVLMVQRLIVGEHGSGQSWILAGGTSTVQQTEIENGSLTVSGGRLVTPFFSLNDTPGSGTMTMSGGEVQVTSHMDIGATTGSKSFVNISGGTLTIASTSPPGSEAPAHIGDGGAGDFRVSSGVFRANTIWVGAVSGSVGTLTVSGGLVDTATGTFGMNLLIGEVANSTGVVSYTSGTLRTLTITVGDAGVGSLLISSNADFQPTTVVVGNQSGAVGSMSLQGGSLFSSPMRRIQTLQIGMTAGSTGTVWVTDGALFAGSPISCLQGSVFVGKLGYGRLSATNSSLDLASLAVGAKGIFECVNSQFATFNTCAEINSNLMLFINSTGTFGGPLQNAGTVTVSGGTVTFSQPVNNSGWIVATNGVVQFSGEINNTGSVLLGPDKFTITSIFATGNDVAITWPVLGGNHYRVQGASSVTDTFFDITSDIVPAIAGFSSTNYLDVGGLTNSANRFYQIRQIY